MEVCGSSGPEVTGEQTEEAPDRNGHVFGPGMVSQDAIVGGCFTFRFTTNLGETGGKAIAMNVKMQERFRDPVDAKLRRQRTKEEAVGGDR